MQDARYYEVEGAVFREEPGGQLEVCNRAGEFVPYKGDPMRVFRLSNPMSLEEVQPYMPQKAQAGEAQVEGAAQGS